jgi:hypothetical protein
MLNLRARYARTERLQMAASRASEGHFRVRRGDLNGQYVFTE